ncbi:MAG TPA: PQQ-dependent sugar dehydrogenase [Myxococcota bacterium]|jgi:glucose/arabinose dehydrogenase
MRRFLLILVILAGASFGACHWLLPERFAVNAPIGHLLFQRGVDAPPAATVAERLRVPEGFSIGQFFTGLPNARFLRPTETGDLLVSVPRTGSVHLLERDADGDGRADGNRTLLEGLEKPHGLDLHQGWLYVAEGNAIGRIRFDPLARATSGAYQRIVSGLPEKGNHWTRTVRVGPDGWLYLSIGSSCNVCEEKDPRRAALLRMRPDGSGQEIYASGLRNTVGFDWRPATGELFATDNGRDLLGDDFPPCELNRITQGGFYGWPYANGENVPDPDFGAGHEARIAAALPPVHGFRAHNAPLGIVFLRAPPAGDAYAGAALVALHGSWNRTRKDGYKVVSLHWDADGKIEERDFAVGFEADGELIGRPVDVAEGPDGAVYISDDYAGVIYRVTRAPAAAPRGGAPAAAAPPGRVDPLAALAGDERAELARSGRSLWEVHRCAGCHEAAAADPGVVVVPLQDLAARHSIESLAALLATPTPPMPVIALTAQERRALAVHLLAPAPRAP